MACPAPLLAASLVFPVQLLSHGCFGYSPRLLNVSWSLLTSFIRSPSIVAKETGNTFLKARHAAGSDASVCSCLRSPCHQHRKDLDLEGRVEDQLCAINTGTLRYLRSSLKRAPMAAGCTRPKAGQPYIRLSRPNFLRPT